jgi:alpha-1,6-mannosyltransferase
VIAKQKWGGLFLGLVSTLAYGGMVALFWSTGTLRDGQTPVTISWYLLAFVAYLGAILWAEKWGFSTRWMWVGAVLFRLLLLFTRPTLSDDVYRYLWDGYVVYQGISPYAYAIEAPELDHLDVSVRDLANNTWMSSPYMPSAQLLFASLATAFPLHPLVIQVTMVVFDLGAGWLLARLLAVAQLPARRLLIYLWNPLVVVEVAHGAHLEAWMALLTLLSLTFTFLEVNRKRDLGRWLAPLFLALATLTKILPAILFPILFWHWNWRQRLAYVVLTLGLLLPFGLGAGWGLRGDLDGTGLFGALRIYSRLWNFNSGPFHWFEAYLGRQGLANPTDKAKLIMLGLFVLLMGGVWILARNRMAPRATLRLISVPLMAFILITPTLHPWYILPLLLFLPFLPPSEAEPAWRWLLAAPWIYLSGALIFSYLTYLDPLAFSELEWVRWLEWLPLLALLLISLLALVRPQSVR